MALVTGSALGTVTAQEDIYFEGAPTIYIQQYEAAPYYNPDADGFVTFKELRKSLVNSQPHVWRRIQQVKVDRLMEQFSASPYRMYATPRRNRVAAADTGSTFSRVRASRNRR